MHHGAVFSGPRHVTHRRLKRDGDLHSRMSVRREKIRLVNRGMHADSGVPQEIAAARAQRRWQFERISIETIWIGRARWFGHSRGANEEWRCAPPRIGSISLSFRAVAGFEITPVSLEVMNTRMAQWDSAVS